MYAWRNWTQEMREEVLQRRKLLNRPWHGPPHFTGQQTSQYLITGTCYEHSPIIGASIERMDDFAQQLQQTFESSHAVIHAWCILLNHYHVLATTPDLPALITQLGKLHGRMSFTWNGEDKSRGRTCWHRLTDRAMRSESHFWTTVNYIHHNPVKHGHAPKWTEWPWSSAHDYLHAQGRESATHIWQDYPILDYGTGWDD
jgi:putative transposase